MKLNDCLPKGSEYLIEILHADRITDWERVSMTITLIQYLSKYGLPDMETLKEVIAYPHEITVIEPEGKVFVANHGKPDFLMLKVTKRAI